MKDFLRDIIKNQTKRRTILLLLAYALFMVLAAIVLSKYVDRELLREMVRNSGSFGVVLFLIIEFFYVVFAPLYNTAIHIGAGYIFGGSLGWLINFVATTAGLFTIIILVRKYGRPLLKRLISKPFYDKYDKLVQKIGPLALFIIYVLPVTPDDEMTYIIAAGPVGIKRFILPILLGNIAKTAMSYIGDRGSAGLAIAGMARAVTLIVGLVVIGFQEFLFRKKSENK